MLLFFLNQHPVLTIYIVGYAFNYAECHGKKCACFISQISLDKSDKSFFVQFPCFTYYYLWNLRILWKLIVLYEKIWIISQYIGDSVLKNLQVSLFPLLYKYIKFNKTVLKKKKYNKKKPVFVTQEENYE